MGVAFEPFLFFSHELCKSHLLSDDYSYTCSSATARVCMRVKDSFKFSLLKASGTIVGSHRRGPQHFRVCLCGAPRGLETTLVRDWGAPGATPQGSVRV